MVAAGDNTAYPAAHWCNDLTIGGYTDWYLPARDELELAWRNLKPVSEGNYTTANRSSSPTPNYTNLGAFGDAVTQHGVNRNSYPLGATHTTSDPAQVASGLNFRDGESEAFAYNILYWSSSDYDATSVWGTLMIPGLQGYQGLNNKTQNNKIRAVRRSII